MLNSCATDRFDVISSEYSQVIRLKVLFYTMGWLSRRAARPVHNSGLLLSECRWLLLQIIIRTSDGFLIFIYIIMSSIQQTADDSACAAADSVSRSTPRLWFITEIQHMMLV